MRIFLFAALVAIGAAGAARSEEIRPSQAACDTKTIDGREGLMSKQKARWRRSLSEAQAQWYAWRDTECQDVAPFEAGMAAKGADPRLACIIDYDAARVASLKIRYP